MPWIRTRKGDRLFLLRRLNPEIVRDAIVDDISEIGYPEAG